MKNLYRLAFIFISTISHCQNYTQDAGMRFGYGFHGTYRQFYKEEMAIEGMIGFSQKGTRFTALKEHFMPVLSGHSSNFKMFYGYGIHAGFAYTNKYRILNREYKHDYKWTPLFGVDGIIGLEYYVPEVPILISADFKPFFEFSVNRYFNMRIFQLGFSVKYRF